MLSEKFFRDTTFDMLLVFAISLTVYWLTLCRVVYVGDSGELTAAALTLGIAHPPGYPLYVLLAKLFSLGVPGRASAFEVNLFSAVCGAGAVSAFYMVCRIIPLSRIVSIVCALMLAFLNPFWSQAVVARVYTLNTLLMLCALYFLLIFRTDGKRRALYGYFVFLGLGMANHFVSIVTVPAALICMLWCKDNRLWTPSAAAKYVGCVVPGMLCYLYLPVRSLFHPVINWGNPGVQKGFWEFIFRTEYWRRAYVESFSDICAVLLHYGKIIQSELLYIGVFFFAVGIIVSARRSVRDALVVWSIIFGNIFFMIIHASRSDIFYWPRYILPALLCVVVLTGYGLDWMVHRMGKKNVLSFCVLLLPLSMAWMNYQRNDRSENYLADDINRHILNSLPPDSIVIAQGDNVLFPISYLHYVEGIRPDIRLFEMGMNALSPLEFHPAKTPTFFTHYNDLGNPDLQLVPFGQVYQVVTKDMPLPHGLTDRFEPRNLAGTSTYFDYLCRCLAGDYLFMRAVNAHRGGFEKARQLYESACAMAHDNDVMHYNYGLILIREKRFADAVNQFQKVLEIDPKNRKAQQYVNELQALQMRYAPQHSADTPSNNSFEQLSMRAEKYFYAGDLENALDTLKRALAIRPHSIRELQNLSALYLLLGDHEQAVQACNTLLEYDAENPVAKNNLANLQEFSAQIALLNIPDDTAALNREKKQDYFDQLMAKFHAEKSSGNPYNALFYLHRADRIMPGSFAAAQQRGILYAELKQYVSARRQLQKAVALKPDDGQIRALLIQLEQVMQQKKANQ